MSKAQGGVARDATRSMQDLRDAIGRHVDLSREFSRAHIECFEIFSQVFTRMDSSECHRNAPSDSRQSPRLMAPRSVSPLEANPPLIVNADTVLALAVAYQRFKTVPRQCRKVSRRRSRLHTVKLQARGSFKSRECLDPFPGGEFSGPLVPIADDHYPIIPGSTRYVKRKGPKKCAANELD